jgi:hypothetical protein
MAAKDQIAAGPPVGGAPKPRYIGLPADYVPTTAAGTPITPLYYDGMENIPAALGAEEIWKKQQALVRAGLIGPKDKFRKGVWDTTTKAAYREELANSTGSDDNSTLAMLANAPIQHERGVERKPLIKAPNPSDVRSVVAASARSIYGHKANDDVINKIVKAYHDASVQQQQAEMAALEAGGGTTIQDMPAMDTFVDASLEAANPEDAAGHRIGELGDLFMSAFRGEA